METGIYFLGEQVEEKQTTYLQILQEVQSHLDEQYLFRIINNDDLEYFRTLLSFEFFRYFRSNRIALHILHEHFPLKRVPSYRHLDQLICDEIIQPHLVGLLRKIEDYEEDPNRLKLADALKKETHAADSKRIVVLLPLEGSTSPESAR